MALVQFAAGSRGGPRRGLGEWGGGRCDDVAGGAGFGHDRTTPWGKLSPAVVMAGSVPLVDGGEGGKTAADTTAGSKALNSTEPVPPDAGQGGLRGRLTAPQPAGGGVTPAWAQHHPRGTRSCDKRRPEHSVGWRCWLAGEQGTHPDSQSRSLAGSRRRAGRGGARRGPGGAERRQAALRHSARGPVSPRVRARQAACRGDVGDSSRALPGSCCSILRARWAAGTPHMPPRPGTTGTQRQHATWAAALLGRLPRLPSTRLSLACGRPRGSRR